VVLRGVVSNCHVACASALGRFLLSVAITAGSMESPVLDADESESRKKKSSACIVTGDIVEISDEAC
jgi:hypothetical protein